MAYSINLNLIKEQRKKAKYTLQEMADTLGLKSKSDYFKRENGDTNFKSTELPIISKKLKIPMKKIFKVNVEKIATN